MLSLVIRFYISTILIKPVNLRSNQSMFVNNIIYRKLSSFGNEGWDDKKRRKG